MANPVDLVTLARVKSWLSIADTGSDNVLSVWITGASRAILNNLSRGPTLAFQTITEYRDGTGTNTLLLDKWPVHTVTALSVNGTIYQAQTSRPLGSGFFWTAWGGDDSQGRQQLWCNGTNFYRGSQNVTVSYTAGYQVPDEVHEVPTGSGATVTVQTFRPYFSDQGVTYADGTALVYVTGTPSVGQYSITAEGLYTFAVGDAGEDVLITYSYTPEDLQQVTVDLVAWHFKNRDRIGMVSRSIGGQETTSFSQEALGATSMMMLQPYKSVTPL